MPAHKSLPWTVQEIAILQDLFPGGGLAVVTEALPGRSAGSITTMASKLRILSGRRGIAPRARLQGELLERAIRHRERDGWSFARIGATFGVSESAACNAVMNALCIRKGFTPAQRDEHGRLTDEGLARLRLALRRGIKPITIQLHLGLSASRIAEERRRYSRELKAAAKVPLPPPGAGEAYSGRKIPKAISQQVEELLLRGIGSTRITRLLPVSNTHIGRIRTRLIKRLARKGECLPGCDIKGRRHTQVDHPRDIRPETIAALRQKFMEGFSIVRAAKAVGIGHSSSFRLRQIFVAELAAEGKSLPPVIVAAPTRKPRKPAEPVPAPLPPLGRRRTFEETLAAVQAGARLMPVHHIRRPDPVATGGSSLA